MNLLQVLRDKISKMSILEKVLGVILLPLTLMLALLKAKRLLQSSHESLVRNEVDQRAENLEADLRAAKNNTSREEGRLEALEEAKSNAVKEIESQDSVSFHNSRKR